MPAFLSVCLNPVVQKTLVLGELREGAVNRSHEYRTDASGKGINVTRVLHQLGQSATHLTQAGGRQRALFLELAAQDGLDVVWVESGSEIRFCYTLLSRNAGTTTEIVEESEPVAESTERSIVAEFGRLIDGCQTLIVSGTKAAGFSDRMFPEMVAAARARGVRVVLDVRGADLKNSLAHAPDVVKPNYEEFVATFFPEAPAGAALEAAVKEKLQELTRDGATRFVLTRGELGALVAEQGRVSLSAPRRVPPVNATGCGDAFTAALASALSRGASLAEAVDEGHEAGAANAALLRPGVIR